MVSVDVKFSFRRRSVDDLRFKKRFDRLVVHLQLNSIHDESFSHCKRVHQDLMLGASCQHVQGGILPSQCDR